ncbi:MAG: JAB domain-containing protein [Emergencia sp.]
MSEEGAFNDSINAKGELIAVDDVSVGELTSTVIHPREVFQLAVRRSAAAVIFIHNHPSGDPTPSRQDLDSTRRLEEGGELLGIRVLDHIIIGDGVYSSLRELGMMN